METTQDRTTREMNTQQQHSHSTKKANNYLRGRQGYVKFQTKMPLSIYFVSTSKRSTILNKKPVQPRTDNPRTLLYKISRSTIRQNSHHNYQSRCELNTTRHNYRKTYKTTHRLRSVRHINYKLHCFLQLRQYFWQRAKSHLPRSLCFPLAVRSQL